ncbi:Divergent PAP2 family protein [compost metagenome]
MVDIVLWLGLSTFATVILSQGIKLIYNWKNVSDIFQDGSFPSSHSATITCFNIVLWAEVINRIKILYNANLSVSDENQIIIFTLIASVSTFYGILVIRDAFGLRGNMQVNSEALNNISLFLVIWHSVLSTSIKDLSAPEIGEIRTKVGHRPIEVLGGMSLGAFVGLAALILMLKLSNLYMLLLIFPLFILVLSFYKYKTTTNVVSTAVVDAAK